MRSMALISASSHRFSKLPDGYTRGQADRPCLSEVVTNCDIIPVIDLTSLDIITQIAYACHHFGFFQVINHDVSRKVVDDLLHVAHEFFNLPLEEKMKLYSNDPTKPIRLSTSFNFNKENMHNWRDYLRLHCHPIDKFAPDWPALPASFKNVVSNYCKQVRELGCRLEEAISESLGLPKDQIANIVGEQGQHMAINYYPPCPEPDLTYGLPPHTDPNTLTILLQDDQVSGLQVLKDNKWLEIKPLRHAFVINIGDQIQALSNGRYKSVKHRAIVNTDKARVSVPTFLCPCDNARIRVPEELRGEGDQSIYREYTYAEYYKKFWSRSLDQEHCLELFKNL